MAEDTTLNVDINAKATGEGDTKALADAVASVGDALRNLVTDSKSAVKVLDRVEQGLSGTTKQARTASRSVSALADAYKEIPTRTTNGGISFRSSADELIAYNQEQIKVRKERELLSKIPLAPNFKSSADDIIKYNQYLKDAEKNAKALNTQLALKPAQAISQATPTLQNAKRYADVPKAANNVLGFKEIADMEKAQAKYAEELRITNGLLTQEEKHLANVSRLSENRDQLNRLTNTRYALYDVSNSLALAGTATLAFNGLILKAASDYQTAMAQISRTSGISGAALDVLQGEFLELAQTIPTSFADLSQIGTLAGQLGVSAGNIASFTETVAQFSATTNVTAEASATAFGRLDALLPDVKGNYDALGSSILTVGVNSVATESEIIATTSQIAAAGAQAGFAADEVIGLAASFASLGVAPEASRGTTIRVFSEIRTAVSEGGEELEEFARLSGLTATQFSQQWSGDAGATFIKVLKGLQAEGSGAEDTLRSLGIYAVRDINSLLKLSQNVEIVADNFGYAADGFENGTQLASAFGVQAETLASKLQMLLNSAQGLVATLGTSGLGPIAGFVDIIKDAIVNLTTLSQNPVAQWAAAIVGALTAFVAILALASAGMIRVATTSIAVRTAFANIAVEAALAGGGVRGYTAALYGAITGSQLLKGALISTGIGALVVLLGSAAAGIEAFTKANRTAGEVAQEAFGDATDISVALRKDTAAAEDGAAVYGKVTGSITTLSTETASWVSQVEQATGGQVELSSATDQATESNRKQVFAIGENTRALLANKIASNQTLQDLIKLNAEQGKKTQFNTKGFLTAAMENDTKKAKEILAAYQADAQSNYAYAANNGIDVFPAAEQIEIGEKAAEVLKLISGELTNGATQQEAMKLAADATGLSINAETGELEGLDGAAVNTADSMDDLATAIANAFSQQNALSAFNQDFATLVQSIYEGGNSFSAFDEAGQVNLGNLQTTIASSIQAGAALGLNASESVALVFRQLQQSGVDTAKLLASLAGIPGVKVGDVKGYVGGTKTMSLEGQALAASLDKTASSAKAASAATKSVGKAAKEAAPEIRTLKDYASDLGGVFNRAFEIRFGGTQAFDTITTGWQSIAKATEDANAKIREAQITLQQLSSDKSIQEYFLSIANQYGDSLRAADISAQLAEINGKIADETANVASAQASSSKELQGNSAAAIANRATLSGLVSNYEDYIEQLAASGLSTEELAAKTAQLKADFIAQATQMGFNIDQVNVYSAAFDDMSAAIAAVPRNVTVTANANPAQQAINEFLANNRNGNGLSSLTGGANIPITSTFDDTAAQKAARAVKLTSQMNGYLRASALSQRNDPASAKRLEDAANAISNQLATGNYKSGGYTGNGGTSQIAGQVHGKEFVVDAPNTARLGLPFLNALNNGAMPTSAQNNAQVSARTGVQLVELAASDKGLLMAIASALNLSIDGKVIAQAANNATLVAARKGSA